MEAKYIFENKPPPYFDSKLVWKIGGPISGDTVPVVSIYNLINLVWEVNRYTGLSDEKFNQLYVSTFTGTQKWCPPMLQESI